MVEVVSSVHKCTAPRINPVDKHRRTIAQWSGRVGVKVGTIGSGERAAPFFFRHSFRGHEIPDRNVVMGVSSVPPLTPTDPRTTVVPPPSFWYLPSRL